MAHNIHRSHQPSKGDDYTGHAHHKEGMNLSGRLRLPNSTQSRSKVGKSKIRGTSVLFELKFRLSTTKIYN